MKLLYEQLKRIDKVNSDKFYLLERTKLEENKYKFNITGSTLNIYELIFDLKNQKYTCNCPDSNDHCKYKNVFCKHICFIFLRVIRLFEIQGLEAKRCVDKTNTNFFEYKTLLEEEKLEFIDKFEKLTLQDNGIVDFVLIDKYKNLISSGEVVKSKFTEIDKARNSDENFCGICFEEYNKETQELLICPLCLNVLHRECMESWLKCGDISCCYCRSDIWKEYLKNGTSEYKNLQ